MKAEILRRAVHNGEVQPPVSPLPQRPAAPENFRQGDFVNDLLSDPTGQLPLQFVAGEMPAYKAGGKNAAALIDEMRLRFEYHVMDEAARQAQQDAFLAERGWNTLDWEAKKQLGILGKGFFSQTGEQLSNPIDRISVPDGMLEPGPWRLFNPELTATDGPRPPQVYRTVQPKEAVEKGAKASGPPGKRGQAAPADAAADTKAAPAKAESAAEAKAAAADARRHAAELRRHDAAAAAQEKRLLAKREQMSKKVSGANC
jgi:hypothetical protein